MSKSKNAIAEIKNLMMQFGFIKDEHSVKSFKLQDNTIVETSDLVVGSSITKISDDFERVVLENGNFRLKENFEIEVRDGKITHVKELFLDATLEDGTKIKVEGEELVEGARVMVVTEDAMLPAPDGIHLLSDGKTKVETKDGKIVSVVSDEEMEDGAMKEKEVVEEEKKSEDVLVDEEMYSLLKDMMEKIADKMKKMEDKMEKVQAEFQAFKKEPAAKRIPNGKTEFTSMETPIENSRVKAIMELRNKK